MDQNSFFFQFLHAKLSPLLFGPREKCLFSPVRFEGLRPKRYSMKFPSQNLDSDY